MSKTKIPWADRVWNPASGCTKISEGCTNCYAERMSIRLAGRCGYPKDNPFAVTIHPEKLMEPLRIKTPSRFFVSSMGDLFHPDVPFGYIEKVFTVMAQPIVNKPDGRHVYIILTKRPDRMAEFISRLSWIGVPDHIWLGVTAETQEHADIRIPKLLQINAAVRLVSIEPMLEPIHFKYGHLAGCAFCCNKDYRAGETCNHFARKECPYCRGTANGPHINFVICGSETGPGARPMDPDWARDLRDQCRSANVAFFMKQVSGKAKIPEDLMIREFPNKLEINHGNP